MLVGGVVAMGIAAEWLAWRLRVPSIVLLLLIGFLAGPVAGFLRPDHLVGPLLLPVVSISVGIILFEGGLSLKVEELKTVGAPVRNLITVGALVTWWVSALAAHFILGFKPGLALLAGAVLIPSGPTVIGPLLRNVRPAGQVGSLLKWEGIMIDPVGAVLAVLVFELVLAGGFQGAAGLLAAGVLRALVVGVVAGCLGAALLVLFLKRHWVPDFLQSAFTLMMVVMIFIGAQFMQSESGLLAATLIGMILANQKRVQVRHIIEFKETLRLLLISALFILLAARIQFSHLESLIGPAALFTALFILIVRPLAVWASTTGGGLSGRERIFLAAVSPRGIVSAAVASVFALHLSELGRPEGQLVAELTFLVIVGTVLVSGSLAGPLARRMGLSQAEPQGVLFAGADPWVRAVAAELKKEGCPVLLADTNWANVSAARMEGLPTYYGSVLSEAALDEMDLGGIGRLVAATPNDEVNALTVQRFANLFGRSQVYQLALARGQKRGRREAVSAALRGRILFGPEVTHEYLEDRFNAGAILKKTNLTPEFDLKTYRAQYGDRAVPLFLIQDRKPKGSRVIPFTAERSPAMRPGSRLLSLIDPPRR